MGYKTKNLPKSEIEIDITIPFADFAPHVKRAAVAISEKVDIQGFRKGKAPYEILKKEIGEDKIYEEGAELAVQKTYPEILEDLFKKYEAEGKEFAPVGRPQITVTKLAPGNEFQYKARLTLLPETTLPDYKFVAGKIQKEKKAVEVKDEEIESTLKWIRDSHAQAITVARPAQIGDLVEIDFETKIDGVKMENGDSKNHPVILGKGNYLPGFEDQVVGMSAGEEKSFVLTAPDNWHEKNLAGKSLDFKVSLKIVQERKVPELTDEFIKSLGGFDSLDTLKQNIQDGLAQEKEEKEKQRVRVLIIEGIAKETKGDIPDVLIEAELDKMLGELKNGIEDMHMIWEDYLLQIKKSPEELRKEWRPEGEKRVRIALALRQIARLEKIEATDREIEEQASKVLSRYPSPEDAAKKIDPRDLKDYARGIVRNEKVFEFLEKI